MRRGYYIFFMLLLAAALLGAGCSRAPQQGAAAQENGDVLGIGIASKAQEWLKGQGGKLIHIVGSAGSSSGEKLSPQQQSVVDGWLSKNKLNQYGDPPGAMYTGGTPLFNEATGESVNRFDYLFKKFPELKDVINQGLKERLGDMVDDVHAQINNWAIKII